MKTFLTAAQVELKNGGYLTSKEGASVGNVAFVNAQQYAHTVITAAKVAKGKDFEGKVAYTKEAFMKELAKELETKARVYKKAPTAPKLKINDQLADEALSFIKFTEDSEVSERVNAFMSQFDVISEFEEHGLFFDQEIVKLEKIYTVKEILKAVELVIDLLG